MKYLVLAALCFPVSASAAYFHLLRPLDEVKSGAFIKVGTPNERVAYGVQTTLIKHRAEDGYLMLPGVSWSLLDFGGAKTEAGKLTLVAGPSIDLSEPIKAVVLAGINELWPDSMGAVKALLAPSVDGKACTAISVGPGLAADFGQLHDVKEIKGSLVFHAGLSAKWGNK
jgi:hypothetical protein